MTLQVVEAAAGCGKTTDLACRYLRFIDQGLDVDSIVAITFTRKAAAELRTRVRLALEACQNPDAAPRTLGGAWRQYLDAAPSDPERVKRALYGLPTAPIGTTDSFVRRLVEENALHAFLPLPDGSAVAVDLPMQSVGSITPLIRSEARALIDPTDGQVDPRVSRLTRYFALDEILDRIAWQGRHDHLPAIDLERVLRACARQLTRQWEVDALAPALGLDADADESAWEHALAPLTGRPGHPYLAEVGRWFAHRGSPPAALTAWAALLNPKHRGYTALTGGRKVTLRLGSGRVSMSDWKGLLEGWSQPQQWALADDLRQDLASLRSEAVTRALRHAAQQGQLTHDAFTEVAIDLLRRGAPRLRERIQALLVDEAQDADPGQHRLYRALRDLPNHSPVQAYFVGDERQSIYLFRGAEPNGFAQLTREATQAGQLAALPVNYRSHGALVQAHHALFEAIEAPLMALGLAPLRSLAQVGASEGNAQPLDPAHHQPSAPVWLLIPPEGEKPTVGEEVAAALTHFLTRVQRAWNGEGRDDTAVVLAPNWNTARQAAEQLRALAKDPAVAWLQAGDGWTEGVAVSDARLLLRALLDPSDEVAWLGVWKLPFVGLTDSALARIRKGEGLAYDGDAPPGWLSRLGLVVEASGLTTPHRADDQAAFATAAPALRAARDSLAGAPPSTVLDQLAEALCWRTVLAALPDSADELASLDVFLDWCRSLEQDGLSARQVLAQLEASQRNEAPHLHLERPLRHIACTTVHQSKGLAWDHVCMLQPGKPSRSKIRDHRDGHVQLEQAYRLEGFSADPTGGLAPSSEPLQRLADHLQGHRNQAETVRLAYVAATRARRSVTLALRTEPYNASPVQELLGTTWSQLEHPAIAVTRWPSGLKPPAPPDSSRGVVTVRDPGLLSPTPAQPPAHRDRRPSDAAAHLDPASLEALVQDIRTRSLLTRGLYVGSDPIPPPETTFPELRSTEWGTLAHDWMATWRFEGEPDPSAAETLLATHGGTPAPVVEWLLALSAQIQQGPLWQWVRSPGTRCHFEVPFVGPSRDLLYRGRIDLLIERDDGLWIIDFKAGGNVPRGTDDLAEQAGLRSYGPQLEAYREGLTAMGYSVRGVGLWFLRSGGSLVW